MQKHVNLVDLVKSFPKNIFLQKLASIQKRTSPVKFAHLAEKSEKGLISNLSTNASAAVAFGSSHVKFVETSARAPEGGWSACTAGAGVSRRCTGLAENVLCEARRG